MNNIRLTHCTKIGVFGKVFPKHAVGVFNATFLPGAVGVSKEDGHARLLGDELVVFVFDAIVGSHGARLYAFCELQDGNCASFLRIRLSSVVDSQTSNTPRSFISVTCK